MDFLTRHWIKPGLHDSPNCCEDIRSIDDVEATHSFWVIILTDLAGLLNIGRHLPKLTDTHVLEIHNSAARFDQILVNGRAHRQTFMETLLVFVH